MQDGFGIFTAKPYNIAVLGGECIKRNAVRQLYERTLWYLFGRADGFALRIVSRAYPHGARCRHLSAVVLSAVGTDDLAREGVGRLLRRFRLVFLRTAFYLRLHRIESLKVYDGFVGILCHILRHLARVFTFAFRDMVLAVEPLQEQIARVVIIPKDA